MTVDLSDSDSDASTPDYSSPEFDDYNTSSDDEDEDEDLGLESEDEKTKALREGFSMNQDLTAKNSPQSTNKDDEWLSTQPAASQSAAATTNKRISPRRKPQGITGAIVGAIKGDVDSLVIPKKKKFQQQKQNQTQQQLHQETNQHQLSAKAQQEEIPTTASNEPSLPTQTQQRQQPPMKKRKVSLSPTDSLAKHRPSSPKAAKGDVISLLADDDDDSDDEILAFKRDRMTQQQEGTIPQQRLSPSLLAAASKQQKEHVQATKERQAKAKAKLPKKRLLSKVSEVSYAENSSVDPKNAGPSTASNDSLRSKPQEDDKETHPSQNTTAASSTKTKSDKAKAMKETKSQEPEATKPAAKSSAAKPSAKSSAAKPATKPTAKSSATKPATKPTAKSSAAKPAGKPVKAANTKTNKKNAKAVETKKEIATAANNNTKHKAAAAAAKPPPKKKKKRITFEDELLQKMFMACRPYSIRDLVQLMGKTTSEASVNFCLLSLIDKKWVLKKEFKSGNRTKELYWANQESKDPKLWALECLQLPSSEKIRETRLELAALQQQQKSLAREMEEVEKAPSNEQLLMLCETAQTQVNHLSAKLEAMKGRIASSSAPQTKDMRKPGLGGNHRFVGKIQKQQQMAKKPMTPLQLKKRINAMRDHWIKRKRKCMDFVDALADGMEKKVKDVVHKVLELETDEAEHAILPPKHAV